MTERVTHVIPDSSTINVFYTLIERETPTARSANRRSIEVPAVFYENLAAEAQQEGITLAAVLQRHVLNSRQLSTQVAELRREVERLANTMEAHS